MAKVLNTTQIQLLLGSGGMVGADGPTISTSTNASPSVATAAAHGRAVGDVLFISGITGNTALNGVRVVATVPDADTMTFTDFFAGTAVNGNGSHGGSPVCKRVTVSMKPIDLRNLQNMLSRKPYVRASDANPTAESTIQTIFGV